MFPSLESYILELTFCLDKKYKDKSNYYIIEELREKGHSAIPPLYTVQHILKVTSNESDDDDALLITVTAVPTAWYYIGLDNNRIVWLNSIINLLEHCEVNDYELYERILLPLPIPIDKPIVEESKLNRFCELGVTKWRYDREYNFIMLYRSTSMEYVQCFIENVCVRKDKLYYSSHLVEHRVHNWMTFEKIDREFIPILNILLSTKVFHMELLIRMIIYVLFCREYSRQHIHNLITFIMTEETHSEDITIREKCYVKKLKDMGCILDTFKHGKELIDTMLCKVFSADNIILEKIHSMLFN